MGNPQSVQAMMARNGPSVAAGGVIQQGRISARLNDLHPSQMHAMTRNQQSKAAQAQFLAMSQNQNVNSVVQIQAANNQQVKVVQKDNHGQHARPIAQSQPSHVNHNAYHMQAVQANQHLMAQHQRASMAQNGQLAQSNAHAVQNSQQAVGFSGNVQSSIVSVPQQKQARTVAMGQQHNQQSLFQNNNYQNVNQQQVFSQNPTPNNNLGSYGYSKFSEIYIN